MLEYWVSKCLDPKSENSSPSHQAIQPFRLLIDSHALARVKPSAKVCEKIDRALSLKVWR